jgi:hypothetical protein
VAAVEYANAPEEKEAAYKADAWSIFFPKRSQFDEDVERVDVDPRKMLR